ncbi:hypothetical protein [Halorussus litoreus]|uniref:hypothetical protein n=1 Tax=Halorussus litoreus TaxID=1710536 RepID=UPI000E260476|nr:hypothetical protein [Halorussus litoreus]
MDAELKRYLNVIVVLLCLIVGLLATLLWAVTDVTPFLLFVFAVVGAMLVGWVAWLVADASA